MEIDWFDLFSTLLQIAVVAFAFIRIVPQMRRSGKSVILVFFLYALICLLLSDIYWISLSVVHPDERLPFSISDVADIGEQLGNRDHSTVVHGVNKIEEQLSTSPQLRETIDVIKKKIYPI